jgi:aryl-alcohol dehydrogenase-like predicted oxidoreductase
VDIRPLGDTGLAVSRIGLGLAALGRPGYINLGHGDDLGGDYRLEGMRARCHGVLDAAYDAGVRYLDAARSYGRAEDFLAAWLAIDPWRAANVCVGSKWGYAYTADWRVDAAVHEAKEHSRARFELQLFESRARLGTHLALYQVHSLTADSPLFDDAALIGELAQLRESGVVVGASVTGAEQAAAIERALALEVDGRRLFQSVQATWNVLERSATAALAAAHDAGVGVIVKEALANGRLTERNTAADFAPAMARLQSEARRMNVGVDALALGLVLAQPWVDVVLSGASTRAQLASNLAAASVALDASANVSLAGLAETPADYWTLRSRLAWN